MEFRIPTLRSGGRGRVPLVVLSLLLAVAARGADDVLTPDNGIAVGPWLLAPSLTTAWSNDSNVFYQSAAANPTSDRVLHVMPELKALLPFRNSEFEGRYRREFRRRNDETDLDNTGYEEYAAALRLRFSTHDTLELTGALTRGQAEVLRFDGGELGLPGRALPAQRLGVALSRDVLGHRGYSLRAQRLDLNFDPDTRFRFFDFRATSVEAEYREPVRPNLSVLATVRAETADHFCRNVTTLGISAPRWGFPSGPSAAAS